MIEGVSSHEDSFLIGFIEEAYVRNAITLDEMKTWIYELLKQHDDLPPYFFDILDIETSCEFENIINFFRRPHTI